MLTNKTLTLATANLFNFVEPPGAFYDFENIYENDAWLEKCRWTKEKLLELNADIVALQEVFSINAAKRLMAEIGYAHFATIDTPHTEQDYIYSQPVVAIASKHPIIRARAVEPLGTISEWYQAQVPVFSRQPLHAVISVPDIGEIAVYVCHLKSQRPAESRDPDKALPIVGEWLSSQQRGWEAVMLRLYIEQQYVLHPIPTALMGDFNQTLASDIVGLLTKPISQDNTQLCLKDSWQLLDGLVPNTPRPSTHYHFAKGNVLDYILLSQEFHASSSHSLADVIHYLTLDSHLINPIYSQDSQASDHAFVAVTARFVL